MRKIVLLVGILVFVSMVGLSVAEESVKKLEGWGGYKFGMTMNQAAGARREAAWEEIDYDPGGKEKCLVFDGEFYGEKGEVVVRFKGGKLHMIQIFFRRYEGGCSKVLLETIYNGLVTTYGLTHVTAKDRVLKWQFPGGGMIELTNFCIYSDQEEFKTGKARGNIFATYQSTEGF